MNKIFAVYLILTTLYFILAAPLALGQGLAPQCDPARPIGGGVVGEEGPVLPPCDIPAFIEFIKNIINWLFRIGVPLAIGFLGYGAFVIMTAGGSGEKVQKGKEVIIATVVGLIILMGSWLIVTTIFKVLLPEGSPYVPQ